MALGGWVLVGLYPAVYPVGVIGLYSRKPGAGPGELSLREQVDLKQTANVFTSAFNFSL